MQIQKLYSLFLESSGISTDTRTLKKRALFFALKGENFNGNLFAEKALNLGATAIVVDDANLKSLGSNVVFVQNTLITLQKLAAYHRKQLNTPIIGLRVATEKQQPKNLYEKYSPKSIWF